MKAKHTSLSLLLAGIALSAEPAAQPQSPDDPSILARQAVESQLLSGIQNRGSLHLFSRVGPPPPPKFEFAGAQTIDGEARLPFTITYGRKKASIQGYVRTKDHAIFLVDAATGKAIPSAQHPLGGMFASVLPTKPVYP